MTTDETDISNLLNDAAKDGSVNAKTTAMLTDARTVAQITKGNGVTADQYQDSEVLIVTVLADDSGSIFNGNEKAVIDGYNAVLEALGGTKQKGRILVSCRYLNGKILCPYMHLESAPKMDERNFVDGGGTPLFDQALVTIGAVMAKGKEFEDAGISARTWTLLITDGADYGSRTAKAANVAELVKTLNSEMHTILAIGVQDGQTDFKAVFASMGIRPEKILISTNDPKEIRRTFRLASQSAAAMNNPAGSAGGTLGGFGG